MHYRIAHSGITWGYDATTAEAAVRDVAKAGYNAYETIGGVIQAYEAAGQDYAVLLDRYNIGLIGTYIGTGFRHGEDPGADIANARAWIQRGQELGASTALLAAGSRKEGPCEDPAGWAGEELLFHAFSIAATIARTWFGSPFAPLTPLSTRSGMSYAWAENIDGW